MSESGYCSKEKPKLKKRLSKEGRIRFYYRFNSYTFSSLNYIYNEFYKSESGIKGVPDNISLNLTPLAFACWIMDDGSRVGCGIKLATNTFLKEDVELLIKTIYEK
jgi:ubiquinol-cytochrome c reductase cytochrome b subunit